MRIGIDARFYGPKLGGGGLGRYVSELVTHLEQLDSNNEYVLFLRKENFHECQLKKANFSKRLVDVPWYGVAEQRILPREIALSKVNFMHFPHWNVPIFSKVPFIVTIHDLILLEDPLSAHATTRNAFVHGIKTAGFRLVLENAIHRSRHIIAVTESTKRSVLKHFRVLPSKISVVYNGVTTPAMGQGVVLRNLGVVEPYILAVGNHYPHKNLDTLIRAFAPVHRKWPDTSLVLAGKQDAFTHKLTQVAYEQGLSKHAFRLINSPDEEVLGALYRHASLLAYPSRLEGFGLPPLEAMRAGVPVMAAHTTSLPEVLGSAAVFVDPDDEVKMTQTMLLALESPAKFQPLVAKGISQAAKYDWQRTAQQTLEVYLHFGLRRV